MADLALIHGQECHGLPSHYEVVAKGQTHQLFVDKRRSWPHALSLTKDAESGCVLALLGTHAQSQAKKILEGLCRYGCRSLEMNTGLVAGIAFFEKTGECCIFRDKMGMIPIMLRLDREHSLLSMTTDPLLQKQLNAKASLRQTWIAEFLRGIDSESRDDVYEGSQRLRAGECLVLKAHPKAPFESGAAKEWAEKKASFAYYWDAADAPYLDGMRHDLRENLHQAMAKAVATIPRDGKNLFTLSGGLDSSGIIGIATDSQQFQAPIPAISLVSKAYPECDESKQLDILAAHLPIQLQRVVMDEAYALADIDSYKAYGAYGPLVAPGIERSLCLHRKARELGDYQRLITGYGGNFIVKVRAEALWRDLIERIDFKTGPRAFFRAKIELLEELSQIRKHPIKSEIARFLANVNDGIIPQMAAKLDALLPIQSASFLQPKGQLMPWLNDNFAHRYPAPKHDPIYALSHHEERRQIPRSWSWEMSTRALDTVARLTEMPIYDPLLDPELYKLSTRIPPRYFLENTQYRALYIEVLHQHLPKAILEHPKTISFDGIVHDGLRTKSVKQIEKTIREIRDKDQINAILDHQALLKAYRSYRKQDALPFTFAHFWRALSLSLAF